MSPEAPPRVGICAIAKNEGAYLEEWVAYHHLIGFDPIRIYSHEPDDDSPQILDRLAERGLAEWTPWSAPPNKKPQWLAYEDGLEELSGRTDWLAFIDLDEFIVIPQHDSIQDFLGEYGHLEAIAMNWKIFGSSGHEKHEPGLVIERFTRCAERSYGGNKQVKTLALTDLIEVPRVHTCHFSPGTEYRTVLGKALPPAREGASMPAGKTDTVSHDIIRVNHYFTRSREEWQAKATRGRGAKPANHPLKHRKEAEFTINDRNEAEEHDIVKFIPKVKALLESLREPAQA
jgi:hypothetical protein